jgi:hypothetical protein
MLAASAAQAAIPAPERQAAEIIVSGRTSTAVKVDVTYTGQEIPRTFSGDKVKNTPGFAWWVSRHWALKTDYPEEKARFYLTLLEQAYPHYVELFGREIPGRSEKRLTVCYASDRQRLREAMASDGVAWDGDGGGITFDDYNCAYAFAGGTLQYHQRYILLHECTHLYQTVLAGTVYTTPPWYYEGVADALASHVYDSAGRRLTVGVLDKPTTHDYCDEGMRELASHPLSAEAIHDGAGGRGAKYLLMHFLSDDPDRAQRLRLWRDEMLRQARRDRCLAESSRLMQELYGPWRRLDADFKAWLASVQSTFHYAEWGWEQDGDTLWSCGGVPGGRLSETDVLLPPAEKPAYNPLRMDWPMGSLSPLVGPASPRQDEGRAAPGQSPVERGVAEPSVGCLIDFSRSPGKGRAGIGLGVIGGGPPSAEPKIEEAKATGGVTVITIGPAPTADPTAGYVAILINDEKELVMDSTPLGVPYRRAAVPKALLEAMAADGHRVGMTVKIATGAVEIVLRAKDPRSGQPVIMKTAWPVSAEVRARLMTRPLAILSRDGPHGVTPYFDDRRRAEPDLSVSAPPNRWRNAGDRQLAALYRTAWRLKSKAPAGLMKLRDTMAAAASKGPEAQAEALTSFYREIAAILKDVRSSGAPEDVLREVVADLTSAGSA